MRAWAAIVRRELQGYFVSPIAYTVMIGFLIITGFGFLRTAREYVMRSAGVMEAAGISLRTLFFPRLVTWTNVAILLCLPALSMRLFSEERKGSTIELLLTSPVTTAKLVLAKYTGALLVYASILVFTVPYVVLVALMGQPEWGAVATMYVGLLLYGGVLLAIGVFSSSLTENQIVAVVLTYAFFLPFFLVDALVGFAGPPVDDILAGFSVGVGLSQFSVGLVDSHYLVLYGALIFTFLFLGGRVLDSSRWR